MLQRKDPYDITSMTKRHTMKHVRTKRHVPPVARAYRLDTRWQPYAKLLHQVMTAALSLINSLKVNHTLCKINKFYNI